SSGASGSKCRCWGDTIAPPRRSMPQEYAAPGERYRHQQDDSGNDECRKTAAGARSQVANLVAAVFCFFTLIFLTPLFRNMPQPKRAIAAQQRKPPVTH